MDRRAFLLLTSSATVASLSQCSEIAMPTPAPSSPSATVITSAPLPLVNDPEPTPTVEPEPDASARTVPLGTARFGPNGAHFPTGAPDPRRGAATIVVAAPTGTAIAVALRGLTKAQIDAGAIVALRTGQIADGLRALAGFQNPGSRPITVCPAEGFGAVTVSGKELLLTGVDGINLTGLLTPTFQLKGCTRTAVSRTIVTRNYASISTYRGLDSTGCGMYEVVMLDSVVKSSDSSQIQNQRAGFKLADVTIAGCVIAPSYYEDGSYGRPGDPSRPHTDSLQITCSEVAPNTGVSIVDTQIWASNNSAMIISGPAQNVRYENALIVGGTTSQVRYPFKPGGAGYSGSQAGPGSLSAIQGTGAGSTDVIDSVLVGSTSPKWRTVTNTDVSLTRVAALASGFVAEPTLATYSDSDFTALGAPRFTQAVLQRLWTWDALTAT